MTAINLGRVKSPKGNSYEVKWDPQTHTIYVGVWTAGQATSATEAMAKAEAYVYNR